MPAQIGLFRLLLDALENLIQPLYPFVGLRLVRLESGRCGSSACLLTSMRAITNILTYIRVLPQEFNFRSWQIATARFLQSVERWRFAGCCSWHDSLAACTLISGKVLFRWYATLGPNMT